MNVNREYCQNKREPLTKTLTSFNFTPRGSLHLISPSKSLDSPPFWTQVSFSEALQGPEKP